jgi:phosphonate transport system substrate-binding protein
MKQEQERMCLSSRILDTTETLGLKLQQTLWVSKEQAKAAEQLRRVAAATRERIETYAPRVERIIGEVQNLAAQSEELGAIGSELATREERTRNDV